VGLVQHDSVGTEIVTDPMRGHERAHFDVLAFQMFDSPTHAVKKDNRYRYYVSTALITRTRSEDLRVNRR